MLIDEKNSELFYKLLVVKYAPSRCLKLSSKKDGMGMFHFEYKCGTLEDKDGSFSSIDKIMKSPEQGVPREVMDGIFAKMITASPEGSTVKFIDLSEFHSLKEQYKEGFAKGFFRQVDESSQVQ